MTIHAEQAQLLKSLHIKGDPLILFNIWDGGSAKIIEKIGAKVIATGSWAVAAVHGYEDGETLPFDLVLVMLVNGQLSAFSADSLIHYLSILGCEVRIRVKKPRSRAGIFLHRGHIAVC